MSRRIRGQEVAIRIAVDGQIRRGSLIKVTDFTATPRQDLVDLDYLGETEQDIDFQHHGWDLAWNVDIQDEKALELLEEIIDAERNRNAQPKIVITAIYSFRDGSGGSDKVVVYHSCFLKVTEEGFSGRTESVTTGFEAKCKRRSLVGSGG